jgi:nitroreductase
MNTIEAIRARRAIKHYDPNHKMSADEERQLLELAMLSPTAFKIGASLSSAIWRRAKKSAPSRGTRRK